MEKKYEILENESIYDEDADCDLYRIRALKNFVVNGIFIRSGSIGGWVESESNLSQEGNCWIMEEAKVYDNAKVYGNAIVFGNARICDVAEVFGNAAVCGHAKICHGINIYGETIILGDADFSRYVDARQFMGDFYYE